MTDKKWTRKIDSEKYIDLLEAVQEIAALIYYQSSLNEQDRWLEDIIVRGIWDIPDEAPDEEIFQNGSE
jgi:hypothetical protein